MEVNANIRIESLPERHFACVNHTGPYMGDFALFGRLFQQATSWLQARNLMGGSSEAITIYYDDPQNTPPEQHRISVGFTVAEAVQGDGEVEIKLLPAGKYLVASFELHPHEYPAAWGAVGKYVQENDVELSGEMMYESYKNDPKTHPEGKQLVDICASLKA